MLLSDKYSPKNISEFCGNAEPAKKIKNWALQFSLNNIQRPVILSGPPGCGKTALAKALASEFDWEIFYVDAPKKSQIDRWERQIGEATKGSSLFANQMLILIEDVHTFSSLKIRGLVSKLTNLIKDSKVPIIITADDYHNKKISSLRPYCESIKLKAVNMLDIKNTLIKINSEQGLRLTADQLQQIALNSQGDLRAAINDLQALNIKTNRDQQKEIHAIIKTCFRSPNYKSTKNQNLGSLMDRSTLKLYVSQSIPEEMNNLEDTANAYNRLSRADVFDGRIMRRQYWGYLRYSSDLLVWGVSSERRHPKASFATYRFPSYIQKMGSSRTKRAIINSATERLKPKLHCSKRDCRSNLTLLSAQAQRADEPTLNKIMTYYDLDEDILASIAGLSLNSLKKAMRPKTGQKQAKN